MEYVRYYTDLTKISWTLYVYDLVIIPAIFQQHACIGSNKMIIYIQIIVTLLSIIISSWRS
jgi:hypothetical protein